MIVPVTAMATRAHGHHGVDLVQLVGGQYVRVGRRWSPYRPLAAQARQLRTADRPGRRATATGRQGVVERGRQPGRVGAR